MLRLQRWTPLKKNKVKNSAFIVFALLAIGGLLYLNFMTGKKAENVSSVIFTDQAPKPIGPYSQAFAKGNAVFVSGQVGIDPATGGLDTSSIENETRQAMKNISAILTAAKLSVNDIVKTTIYLTDLSKFKTVNDIYGSYFKQNPPARETVQVTALPKGAHIEISCMAIH